MYESEIVNRAGMLYVLDYPTSDWNRPVMVRLAWPTGVRTSVYPDLVGQRCHYIGVSGCNDGVYKTASGFYLALEERGTTKSSAKYTEETPIPQPKGTREYRNGEWKR